MSFLAFQKSLFRNTLCALTYSRDCLTMHCSLVHEPVFANCTCQCCPCSVGLAWVLSVKIKTAHCTLGAACSLLDLSSCWTVIFAFWSWMLVTMAQLIMPFVSFMLHRSMITLSANRLCVQSEGTWLFVMPSMIG